ncbi:MAG: (2Fe-2S)-binding protein [Bacteroidota bacterium]
MKTQEITLNINGEAVTLQVEPEMPLLWVLRDELNMTGTKFGCGVAACGACSVMLNGNVIRSCSYPVGATVDQEIKTIEGLAEDGERTAVQQAWIDHQVPQCGYCQSGMIMAVEAMLDRTPEPTDDDIDRTITNICRCGTYQRIRDAVHDAAEKRLNEQQQTT